MGFHYTLNTPFFSLQCFIEIQVYWTLAGNLFKSIRLENIRKKNYYCSIYMKTINFCSLPKLTTSVFLSKGRLPLLHPP